MALTEMLQQMRQAAARTTPEQRDQRLAACRACPAYLKTPIERCGKCGCPLVSKTTLLRATCPFDPPRW